MHSLFFFALAEIQIANKHTLKPDWEGKNIDNHACTSLKNLAEKTTFFSSYSERLCACERARVCVRERRLRTDHIQMRFRCVSIETTPSETQMWCHFKIKNVYVSRSRVVVIGLRACVFSVPLQCTSFFASKYKRSKWLLSFLPEGVLVVWVCLGTTCIQTPRHGKHSAYAQLPVCRDAHFFSRYHPNQRL